MQYHDSLDDDMLRHYAAALNARAAAFGHTTRLTIDALRDRILECGGYCEWCAVSLVGAPFEVDHLISLSSGGAHTPENLAVACPDCNRRKASRHPATFAFECVAHTGRQTALIARVLAHYRADPPATQLSLFDN